MSRRRARTVVFLAPGFSEPGGCASHGRKIAEGLAERGWRVHVVARLHPARRFRRTRLPNLTVTEVPGFRRQRLGGALFMAIAFPLVLCRRGPDAFMAMQLSSPATVASLAARLHPRAHLVVFSTSTGSAGEVAFVRGSRLSRLRRALLSRATTLIAQTDDGGGELRELLPGRRVVVLPTPVRVPEPVPPLRGGRSAVYTGRLVRGKNLETLVGLWPNVAAKVPGARLTLVGAGTPGDPVEASLRRLMAIDARLNGSVAMTGWVPDVAPYLRVADVFVFPSESEGMSNALLEACAFGRVVVASDIASNRAVLGDDYPLLFDVRDSAQLVDVLVAGLTDDALRRQAREQILGRVTSFEVSSVVDRIEELIRT